MIAVTIITGFLGAGKTTFLNQIIKQNSSKKFAIIENEFGEINIDSQLVISTNQNIFELSNGCICCSLNGDLSSLLNKLVTSDYNFDHLIIETTGIADPSAVAAVFLSDYNIQTVFKLDGVICLVDTQNVLNILGVEEVASKQIAFADFLLYNKASTVSETLKTEISKTVKTINPFAEMAFCDFSETQTPDLLDLQAYQNKKASFMLSIHPTQKQTYFFAQQHSHNHIVSQGYRITESLDLLKIRHYFTVMLFIQGAYFYRIKGLLNIEGYDKRLIIQSVKGAPVFTEGEAWQAGENRETLIVFIGKSLKREILEKSLKQCIYKP
ncbi:MAG: GTP-binding protein [Sphingobacteriales bacterium]|nr:MAG: GTP-binding protein [Sphingobacteriales bacterium]TAF80915.1 MAG: GTP-binding protein [Sphingobacteriales bacterium]